MIIRKLREDETVLLKDFLYKAIFIPEGMQPPDGSIINLPELTIYYENFGNGPADNCLVAEMDGKNDAQNAGTVEEPGLEESVSRSTEGKLCGQDV